MNDAPLNPSTLPPLPRPAYKDRRGWLIAFGIVEILIACFFLFMCAFMALVIPNIPKQPGQPDVPSAIFFLGAGFYGVLAAIFATAGIGSMQAKNWARILMIVLSSIWLAFGALGTLSAALMMPMILRQQEAILSQNPAMQQGQLPPNFMTVVMTITIVFQVLIMIVLPLIFLIFYTRKSVKATCEALATPTLPAVPSGFAPPVATAAGTVASPVAGPPRPTVAAKTLPVPIILVMIWFGLVTLSGLITALSFPLTILFGVKIQGIEARLILLALAAVHGFCLWGFYKLRIAGWWTAIAVSALSVLSGIVTVIRMNPANFSSFYDDAYRRMGIDPQQAKVFMPDPHMISVFQWMGWLIAVALFAFVLYTKRYFPTNSSRT